MLEPLGVTFHPASWLGRESCRETALFVMLWLMAYLGIVALLVPHIRKGSTEASVARSMLRLLLTATPTF